MVTLVTSQKGEVGVWDKNEQKKKSRVERKGCWTLRGKEPQSKES